MHFLGVEQNLPGDLGSGRCLVWELRGSSSIGCAQLGAATVESTVSVEAYVVFGEDFVGEKLHRMDNLEVDIAYRQSPFCVSDK